MTDERCIECVGNRKIECDSVRDEVAKKLAMLMEYSNLCHGFGYMPPACVTNTAYKLTDLGCAVPPYELVKELNPTEIS